MLDFNTIPIANTLFNSVGVSNTSRSISPTVPLFTVSFIATDTKLSEFSLYTPVATGSPILNAYIVPSDPSAGITATPINTPITGAIATSLNNAGISGSTVFSVFSDHTLTIGNEYFLVINFISGTSLSIYFVNAGLITSVATTKTSFYNAIRWESSSASEPVTWGTSGSFGSFGGIQIKYTSGQVFSVTGLIGAGTQFENRIYHTNSSTWVGAGPEYILSPNQYCNVAGFAPVLRKANASFSGSLYVDAYINGAKVATSKEIPPSYTSTSASIIIFEFPRVLCVPPGAKIAFIVLSTENAIDTSVVYTYLYVCNFEDSPENRKVLPCNGQIWSLTRNEAANTFVKYSNKIYQAAILLDGTNPFPPAPLNRRKYINQR